MNWLKERGAAIAASWQERRYMLPSLIIAVSTLAGLAVTGLNRAGVNLSWLLPWLFGLFVAVVLGILWILEYTVKLRKQIRGTRVGLSELREEGVGIRNAGMHPFPNPSSWTAWQESALDWEGRVIEKIKEINEADAVWFKTLDVVPNPRLPLSLTKPPETWQAERRKLYGEHDFRLKRLGEMIQNLWRD